MTFTFRIANNYSTLDFTVEGIPTSEQYAEIKQACSLLDELAIKDGKKAQTAGKQLSERQKQVLLRNKYTEAEISAMSYDDCKAILNRILGGAK